MNVASQIQRFNAGRDPERLQLKYSAMRTNPFVFLRGTCHLFYDRLPRGGVFKSAPLAWVCGDLHLENFGSYKGDNRQGRFVKVVEIEIGEAVVALVAAEVFQVQVAAHPGQWR